MCDQDGNRSTFWGDEKMAWVSVGFGVVSALAWIASAITTPVLTATYWDGPPAPLVRRMRLGSSLNAIGAICAAISIGAQAWVVAVAT